MISFDGTYRSMIAVILSAVLYGFSFPNVLSKFGFGWLAWIALVLLLIGLHNQTLLQRFRLGAVFGIVAYSLIVSWLWSLHWAGTLLFVIVLSIQPICFVLFYLPHRNFLMNLLYVPSLWVASEWLRTILLNGFCFSLGYSQAFNFMTAQFASWGGAYAVAFVIVGVNYCLYFSLRFSKQRTMYLILACVIFLGNFCYGMIKVFDDARQALSVLVAAIQPNISPEHKLDSKSYESNMNRHIVLTQHALQHGPVDLIVWPETAFPWDFVKDRVWFLRIQQLAVKSNAFVLLGAATFQEERNFNSAVMLASTGELLKTYHKNHLVPLCEYCPNNQLIQWVKHIYHWTGFDFSAGKGLGNFSIVTADKKIAQFGTLICSESCYPGMARRLVLQGADFIVVMLNDGWLRKSQAVMLHAQNAIMRAIETGRDLVSVANTGWTFHADHHGVIGINDSFDIKAPRSGIFSVAPHKRQTFYGRFGDIFSVMCLLFVIIIRLCWKLKNFQLRRIRSIENNE